MRIKKIKLENIRSYLKSEINFPEGSLLLSGNIGSGKSTILLALEFALFGLKGSLDAASILRNGKNSGSVELHFSITENEIIIKRTLKRVRDRIENDYCEISINDKREVLSASELRQRVI
ncbi:MAG: AAA family ATPase, partial [Nanoarchaeota archaeon]